MDNVAAVIPAAQGPIELRNVDMYTPQSGELLVQNQALALLPVDAKIAKLGIPPVTYPAIVGVSFGGTVKAIGPNVTNFRPGDRVAVFSSRASGLDDGEGWNASGDLGLKYGAYQRYALAKDILTSKVPEGADLTSMVNIIGNLLTVVGLLSGRAGLERPCLDGSPPIRKERVFIYGGSSSVGSLAIQYAFQAGYQVITTSSPRNRGFVSTLGASKIFDHTKAADEVVQSVAAEGPYEMIVDAITVNDSLTIASKILASQGGGTMFTLLPVPDSIRLPVCVDTEFAPWQVFLMKKENLSLRDWLLNTYLPQGVLSGSLAAVQSEVIPGGLVSLDGALSRLINGVSSKKLIIDPQE